MIIDDSKLLEVLASGNSYFFKYDEIDLSDQHILDELAKIKEMCIRFTKKSDFISIENTIRQFCVLANKCSNLELVRVHSTNFDSRKIYINSLIDVLVNQNINQVIISDFNYDYLSLYNKILSSEGKTIVKLDKINDALNGFTYIFGKEKLRKRLHFDSYGNDELNDLYKELDISSGSISLENYEKYKNYLINYNNYYISIGNVNDLDLNKLESIKNDNHVKGINIKCGFGDNINANHYSIEEYENIRKIVNNIIEMIKLPKDDDPNRDKLIFAQLYKILGKNIRYDHYAISNDGKNDEILSWNCRNLKNGLLGVNRNNKKELLAVCAGYATILQNLCACFNIRCDYISSLSKEIVTPGVTVFRGPRQYENGTSDPMGHAYNAVYLDGKAYLCDLTWDADLMKLDKLGNHFLKSYEEFYKSHRDEGFSSDNVTVVTQDGKVERTLNPELFINSCSIDEQIQLFGSVAKGNIDEMISEGYLADFVMNSIEHIKQVKGKVGMQEYMDLIKTIRLVEDYIKSSKFKQFASQTSQSADSIIKEVTSMEEKQWKMR